MISALVVALGDRVVRLGAFVRDLPGSSRLHGVDWVIMVSVDRMRLDGEVAKEPNYRLYLKPKYVETEPWT